MNYLTETEEMTLRHIFKFDNNKIRQFESLNLDDKARSFLIFDMMLMAYERGRKKIK
jgi:hypothetical protein